MALKKLAIDAVELANKRVLMRVDFNVPVVDGTVRNNRRIVAAMESIQYALDKQAKSVVLMSHLGRPNGHKDEKYTMKPVADELTKLFKGKKEILFLNDCVGSDVENACSDPTPGSLILLENLRFHIEEEGKGKDSTGKQVKARRDHVKGFRESLRKLADVYVNDAFGTAHRPHSSMLGEGFETRAAGFLMMRELKYFSKVLHTPDYPFLVIIGGAKVADKIRVIEHLLTRVSEMIITGGMAFTFLKQIEGMKIGKSLFEPEGTKIVQKLWEIGEINHVKIHLPIDFIAGDEVSPKAFTTGATIESGIHDCMMGLDIGPRTRELFAEKMLCSKLIVWNGPPGVFEVEQFSHGTKSMMNAAVDATGRDTVTILGGGDTVAAAKMFNVEHLVSHVSTGGGAMLELLEGKTLPGIAALSDA